MDITSFVESGSILTLNSGDLLVGWGKKKVSNQPLGIFSLFITDFFLSDKEPWISFENQEIMTTSKLAALLASIEKRVVKKITWKNPEEQFFSTFFDCLKNEYFCTGILEKGVPFTFQESVQGPDKFQLISSLQHLLEHKKSELFYIYGYWDNERGILGATPEILFTRSSNTPYKVSTVACAGTKDKKEGNELFLSDDKERKEHLLVVNGIKEALSTYGNVSIQPTKISPFADLKHLLTPIELTSEEIIPFQTLVESLHPTPALGTYPKKEGAVWLKMLQSQVDRALFGAPIGYVNNQTLDAACYVAIRNIQWTKDFMRVFAGCGVINESNKDKEWKEVQLKLKTIKKMLALESLV